MLAVSMVAMLTAIYLYQNGYHLTFIMGYFACYFVVRGAMVLPSSFVIARIGPKHATLISNLLYVPGLFCLTQLPEYGLPALAVFGLFQAMSVALYDVSYMVNFSKVKKDDHVGKELGFMFIIERVTHSLSPLVGGFVAYLFGPESTMVFAAIVFGLAALPLLFTPEPTKTHQHITFRGLNWKKIRKNLVAEAALGADFVISSSTWTLFLAIAIFGTTTNTVYAQIGALASFTVIASLAFAKIYGILIDRRRGGELLRVGAIANSLIHLVRPFIATPVGAVMINVTNEAATTGYTMPFVKGMFATADDLPGYRIVYLSCMSIAASIGAATLAATVALISSATNEIAALQLSFLIMSVISLLILRHGFSALRTGRVL